MGILNIDINKEYVVLVDEQDQELGKMEKLQAHKEGRLHRAISVFIFNEQKQMLLQRRASQKYHSAGLWTNTCCSHPRPGESPNEAAKRRLMEEMGLQCQLNYLFNFTYRATLENDLTENELDHVFVGFTNDAPIANTDEVAEYQYADLLSIQNRLIQEPTNFTVWFKLIFNRIKTEIL